MSRSGYGEGISSDSGSESSFLQTENVGRETRYRDGIIEQLVNNCAKLYAEKVAVRYGERSATYAEVLLSAKKVAAAIQSSDTGNSPAGLVCSKNINFVSAWLGGILSGKLFFQIDGSWPFQRIDTLLKSVGCRLLIDAVDDGQNRFVEQNILKVLSWQEIIADTDLHYSERDLQDYRKPAYMLFTSGSTGKPKAVVNNIRSIDHFF